MYTHVPVLCAGTLRIMVVGRASVDITELFVVCLSVLRVLLFCHADARHKVKHQRAKRDAPSDLPGDSAPPVPSCSLFVCPSHLNLPLFQFQAIHRTFPTYFVRLFDPSTVFTAVTLKAIKRFFREFGFAVPSYVTLDTGMYFTLLTARERRT